MQCDECGKEVTGICEYPNAYGFRFCSPLDVTPEEESCEEKFDRKLWEKAQADKQAEHKTESAAPEASGDQAEMVERGTVSR